MLYIILVRVFVKKNIIMELVLIENYLIIKMVRLKNVEKFNAISMWDQAHILS